MSWELWLKQERSQQSPPVGGDATSMAPTRGIGWRERNGASKGALSDPVEYARNAKVRQGLRRECVKAKRNVPVLDEIEMSSFNDLWALVKTRAVGSKERWACFVRPRLRQRPSASSSGAARRQGRRRSASPCSSRCDRSSSRGARHPAPARRSLLRGGRPLIPAIVR
jgi:hypothetical protein